MLFGFLEWHVSFNFWWELRCICIRCCSHFSVIIFSNTLNHNDCFWCFLQKNHVTGFSSCTEAGKDLMLSGFTSLLTSSSSSLDLLLFLCHCFLIKRLLLQRGPCGVVFEVLAATSSFPQQHLFPLVDR